MVNARSSDEEVSIGVAIDVTSCGNSNTNLTLLAVYISPLR